MTAKSPALPAISDAIWRRKYRFSGSASAPADQTLEDTFRRVARAAASVEKGGKRQQQKWATRFTTRWPISAFSLPGRILAGAGTDRNVTLFNCFVLGEIADDLSSIFDSVKEAALTMQAGGGIGHDFSTLRPRGAPVKSIGADASGPVELHGRLGRNVPDDHVGRAAARRDDGDAQMRSSGYRGFHRGEGGFAAAQEFQSVGSGDRCLHGRRAPECAVGSRV